LGVEIRGSAHLLEGACSLDKALNANTWLSAAKMIEKIK
jgi:hypothetical protein